MTQSIGHFQFDNLVRGRVGFIFINLGVDTSEIYPHVFKMHLEQKMLQLPEGDLSSATNEKILEAMQSQNKEAAVVILDSTGTRSQILAKALENAGFINTVYLQGGWKQFLKDRV